LGMLYKNKLHILWVGIMSKMFDLIMKAEKQKRSTKRSTANVQLFTAEYDGLTREEKKRLEKYYNDIESAERCEGRILLHTPESSLTREEKKRLEKYYNEKGIMVSLGQQLKVIKVYDQGYILPYECTVNAEKAVILFASVYIFGNLYVKQSAGCSETWFNELMEKDTDTIQNAAVRVFPALYKVPTPTN